MLELIDVHDPVEDCDCQECALFFRNKYRNALDQISADMGPASGDLKRVLETGAAAAKALSDAPRAISAEIDFDAMTWTFKIDRNCSAGAGIYALVWLRKTTRG